MNKDDSIKKALHELGVEKPDKEEEVVEEEGEIKEEEEGFDFNAMKKNLALELEKAKKYVEEKKKTMLPPEERNKKLTTLPDAEERTILSDLHVKESVLETINIRPEAWQPEISRLTLEVAALRFRLEEYKIKEGEEVKEE